MTYKESKDNPLHRDFGLWSNTRFVLNRIRKYCPIVFLLAFTDLFCASVQSYLGGFLSKFIVDAITIDLPMAEKQHRLIVIIIIAALIALAFSFGRTIAGSLVWPRYIDVRMHVIHERAAKAMRMNYAMLEKPEALDLHQRAQNSTDGNSNGFEGMMHLMQDLGKNLFTTIVTFIAVLVLDYRLILALTVMGVLSFLYYRVILKKDKKEVWDRLAPVWRKSSYMARVTQQPEYAKDIRLFSMIPFLLKKQRAVFETREERIDYHQDLWNRNMVFGQLMNVICRFLTYTVLYFAIIREINPMSIGSFTLYLALANAFSGALIYLLQRFGDFNRASMEVDDLRSFLELNGEEGENLLPLPETDSLELQFHDVSYRYPEADKDALSHLNLTLHPGEKLAVVGLNGAGKTTMIKLLLRLYDPTEGLITLNGTDIRKYLREDYYRLFSPVFQNVELFALPLAENVSMLPMQETDREKAAACLQEAGLGDKLDELPKGLDTELLKIASEEGVDLSGGEKQKLALARALYKGAPVVVLDEPTAALDALAEKQLYERFDRMIGKKSAVYISHRLASTRFCDRIAMFMDGRLAEYGTHDELMAKGGEYAHLFDVQAQYYREHPEGEEDAE